MGYNLAFKARDPGKTISEEDYRAYFQQRPHYEIDGDMACYQNEDTGVYFWFDYDHDTDSRAEMADLQLLPISFNLNFMRPHPFALEAEPEVAAFVRAFDLTVFDTDIDGMRDGEYSRDGFLRCWNTGNRLGCTAGRSQEEQASWLKLPAATLEACWRWNLELKAIQAELGKYVFVPLIKFINDAGTVRTASTWGDGIPTLLPVVDRIIVPREELAPRKWLRAQPDRVLFTWQELEPILAPYARREGEIQAVELFYREMPPDVERVLRSKPTPAVAVETIPFYQILDEELFMRTAVDPEK
jgi:hypothetical protein